MVLKRLFRWIKSVDNYLISVKIDEYMEQGSDKPSQKIPASSYLIIAAGSIFLLALLVIGAMAICAWNDIPINSGSSRAAFTVPAEQIQILVTPRAPKVIELNVTYQSYIDNPKIDTKFPSPNIRKKIFNSNGDTWDLTFAYNFHNECGYYGNQVDYKYQRMARASGIYDWTVKEEHGHERIEYLVNEMIKHQQDAKDREILYPIVAYVQSMKYISDEKNWIDEEYTQYPMETLLAHTGDCEDTAALLAVMLTEAGYDAPLIQWSNHMTVGVNIHQLGVWDDRGKAQTINDGYLKDYAIIDTTYRQEPGTWDWTEDYGTENPVIIHFTTEPYGYPQRLCTAPSGREVMCSAVNEVARSSSIVKTSGTKKSVTVTEVTTVPPTAASSEPQYQNGYVVGGMSAKTGKYEYAAVGWYESYGDRYFYFTLPYYYKFSSQDLQYTELSTNDYCMDRKSFEKNYPDLFVTNRVDVPKM